MDIFETIETYLAQGQEGVLGTIVKKTGAAPQVSGAKIFIGEDGKIYGTVGGGCMEAEVWQASRQILKTGESTILRYVLDGDSVENEGMICGGSIELLLEPVLARYRTIYMMAGRLQREGKAGVVATHFETGRFSKTLFTGEGLTIGDHPDSRMVPNRSLFQEMSPVVTSGVVYEPLRGASNLIIYGAGHISRFIARIAKLVDFFVIVMDDRKSFANQELFPEADRIIVGNFEKIPLDITGNDETYAVVVTRGHKHDALVLEHILTRKHRYIGMIGSRRKTKIIMDHLLEKGFDESLLETIHAPIGLAINSETPQEIALSIVAELVKVRRGKRL